MDFDKLAYEARKRGGQVLELLKEAAFEISWDVRDSAKTGFGIPGLVSSAASLGVATVAAAGVASVAFDFTGKIWGKKECYTCNGWEGLLCKICRGSGKVQYRIKEDSFSGADRSSSQTLAEAALDGRGQVEYLPATVKLGLPWPYAECPNCEGTGVMTCTTCKGTAWVPKFTIARTMNAPWLAWDAYRKIQDPVELPTAFMKDPVIGIMATVGIDKLEKGFRYDDVVNRPEYQDALEYDTIRDQVARREPGWEKLQKILFIKDPQRAAQDPVVVANPAYYEAKSKISEMINNLQVPPRPANWTSGRSPLKESDSIREESKDKKRPENKVVLEEQEKIFSKVLDSDWENHWRAQKFQELKREIIESYEQSVEKKRQPTPEPEVKKTRPGVGTGSPSTSTSKQQAKVVVKKKEEVKKKPEDDKKKRERLERSERMARQAAEREAALAKAKAAREKRGG